MKKKNVFRNILEQSNYKEIEIGKPIIIERENGSRFRLNPYLEPNGNQIKEKIKVGNRLSEVPKYRYFDEDTHNSLGKDLCININLNSLKCQKDYVAQLLSEEKMEQLEKQDSIYIDVTQKD